MLKKIFFFVILIFLNTNNLYSNDNIVYMDFNYVINNSNVGKKVLLELNNLNEKNIKDLKDHQSRLKEEIDEINKIKNIASKEDLKNKISTHNQNAKDYENLKKKLSNELNKKRNEEMNRLVELINPILENYMKDKSVDMILNKEIVYFAKDKYDISKIILELTNNKYK
jgi:Skp family chaperone for outer membrane proteins